jgi:hypothetical protein
MLGVDNRNNLHRTQKEHISATHLQYTLDLLHFGQQRIGESLHNQLRFNTSEHNKRVSRNIWNYYSMWLASWQTRNCLSEVIMNLNNE